MALALARHAVASVVVEADRGVCVGSRAICLSRRTLEILDRLGVLEPFNEKGLPWTSGRSFYRRDQVLQFRMPHDDDQRLAPMTNLQQYYIEQFLLNEALRHQGLIEIRWGTRIMDVLPDATGVEVELEAEDIRYRTRAEYVIACDGARSRVRQALGLQLSGMAYEGRYVIVDIELHIDLPTERLAWFDPPSNPGRTMLMHKQPDHVWRLDYQLHAHENAEAMIQPDKVIPVVQAHLRMLGIDKPWRLIWISTYKAAALSLDSYRVGRVLFAGDAAHLVPIFGVRGLNSGFDDVFNLGWKLAAVLDGRAREALLDSYSEERRRAWEINVAQAMKSTAFMAPPSHGYEIMREAVLSLAARYPALSTLINPRQSSAIGYEDSRLNTVTRDESNFSRGPHAGMPLPECPLLIDGVRRYLTELLSDRFVVLVFAPSEALPSELTEEVRAAADQGWVLSVVLVSDGSAEISAPLPPSVARLRATDAWGRFRALFDPEPSAIYLVRPDGHVCARWRTLRHQDLSDALNRARGGGHSERVQ
jgi:3-(3-hydroxy-phenyl)propionate hydroxylase